MSNPYRPTKSQVADRELGDPVFQNSKRETFELLIAFSVFLIWSVGVSYAMGYGKPTSTPSTVLGVPSWAFWGVGLPWMGAILYTIYFCWLRMADDPLEDLADLKNDTPEEHE